MRTVKEFMTSSPATIEAQSSIADAARLMRDREVGMLPVVEAGRLIGVVTDRDLVTRALATSEMTATVGDVATKPPATVRPDCNESEAASAMESAKVRRLLVEENGKVIGVVSVGDLAVRVNPQSAGQVMEGTGPDADGESEPRHWPGAELTRNRLSNESGLADKAIPGDVARDISQEGIHPAP
jgi:CBS domain-containing protein